MAKRIFADFLSPAALLREAEKAMRPEPDMDRIGEAWGYRGVGVVTTGDHGTMRRVVEKMRADRLDLINRRLPIWC